MSSRCEDAVRRCSMGQMNKCQPVRIFVAKSEVHYDFDLLRHWVASQRNYGHQ